MSLAGSPKCERLVRGRPVRGWWVVGGGWWMVRGGSGGCGWRLSAERDEHLATNHTIYIASSGRRHGGAKLFVGAAWLTAVLSCSWAHRTTALKQTVDAELLCRSISQTNGRFGMEAVGSSDCQGTLAVASFPYFLVAN